MSPCEDLGDLSQLANEITLMMSIDNIHAKFVDPRTDNVSSDQTCPKQLVDPMIDVLSDLTHPKQIITSKGRCRPDGQRCYVSFPHQHHKSSLNVPK